MPLTNGRNPEFRFDGDYIHFKMEDGGGVVACAVTCDYLEGLAAKVGMKSQSCRAIFTVFRAEIEAKASDKFDQGMARPLITSADL